MQGLNFCECIKIIISKIITGINEKLHTLQTEIYFLLFFSKTWSLQIVATLIKLDWTLLELAWHSWLQQCSRMYLCPHDKLNLGLTLKPSSCCYMWGSDAPSPSALPNRSVGNTLMQRQRPNHSTLKPSKLIPLEVGRHGGDKAKPLPLLFFSPSLSFSPMLPYLFLCSELRQEGRRGRYPQFRCPIVSLWCASS